MAAKLKIRRAWFMAWGWFKVPISWQGALLVAFGLGFCVQVSLIIDSHTNSASDTFYGAFPYWVCAFYIVDWIGSKTSD